MRHHDVDTGRSFRIDRRRLLAALPLAFAGMSLPITVTARQSKPDLSNGDHDGGLASLHELLEYIPASLHDEPGSSGLVWTYADFAAQLASLDVPMPDGSGELPEGYVNAVSVLASVSGIYAYALDEEFTGAIGFKPLTVDRSFLAGTPPSQISLHNGGIDLDALPAAWAASGYSEMTTASGIPWWNLAEDGAFDIENPIQRRVISALNNMAVLDDVVVATGSIGAMEDVIAAWLGETDALSGHDATLRALSGLPEDTVSAAGINPVTYFAAAVPPADIIAEFDEAIGPMPVLDAIVTGITGGFHPVADDGLDPDATPANGLDASRIVTCLVAQTDDAAAEAATVAEYRWQNGSSIQTGEPLNELMPLASATSDEDVAILEYRNPRSPRAWFSIFMAQDAFAFAPGE